MSFTLTDEQQAVVTHPMGSHARVLAVAGAGKTTTMAYRIKHLVQHEHIRPERIAVLMFNRRARQQFQAKLTGLMTPSAHPMVHTFHSYAYSLINTAIQRRILPGKYRWWINDHEEIARITLKRAIQALEQNDIIPPDEIDTDMAGEAISLWKGSLIPPARAGHRLNAYLPQVYEQFEMMRREQNALTFDDFVPFAISLLTHGNSLRDSVLAQYDVIIVDEYQDVNHGQQRLVELLANGRADLMVVGDDDQTIYEWRGARPQYIIHDFPKIFSDKPTADYTLSYTFRFGAALAQLAHNAISFNRGRVFKKILAHDIARPADMHILHAPAEEATAINKELASQVIELVRETNDPRQVIVLARMFSQLSGLEIEFINQRIPYRILGRGAFFERREITALLDYVHLAQKLEHPMGDNERTLLLSIANIPNRRIRKHTLEQAIGHATTQRLSTQELLLRLSDGDDNIFGDAFKFYARDSLADLLFVLQQVRRRISDDAHNAGDVLAWLVAKVDYQAHFQDYYGKGEASHDRLVAVQAFITFARDLRKSVPELLAHLGTLDTTHGQPQQRQIVMTTVYRVKGEEFDYVVIPNCEEGFMPFIADSLNTIYDREGIVAEPEPSDNISNERRLFYVAITRARKAVYIGASLPPKGELPEMPVAVLSRFIEEMQVMPTLPLMQGFQRAASGNIAARNVLFSQMQKHASYRKIMTMLTHDYLPRANITLSDDVQHAVNIAPETPFAYQHLKPDTPPDKRPSSDSRPSPDTRKNWWDDLPF